jgi:hypothetical protein
LLVSLGFGQRHFILRAMGNPPSTTPKDNVSIMSRLAVGL